MTKINIPLVDLKVQNKKLMGELIPAIEKVIESGNFILGQDVREFEKEFAKYCGTKYAVGVASGTDALVLGLIAAGVGEGDRVITTPFSFIATTEAICRVGAIPVFVDISEDTYNIDCAKIEECIVAHKKNSAVRIKAILLVHLYGLPCEMNAIMRLARRHNLKIIEDCAQSFGSEYRGKKVGSFGDAGCFSFFPSKNLGCFGDGGIITTNDKKLAEKLMMLRNHGSFKQYHYSEHGFNSRLDTIQAAILRLKLRHVDKWIQMRRENALDYNRLLSSLPGVVAPSEPKGVRHSFNYYTIRIKDNAGRNENARDSVQKRLGKNGVATAVYYPLSLHLLTLYKRLKYRRGDFPVSEQMEKELLSLPMCPELKKPQIRQICDIINDSLCHCGG